MNYVIIQPPTKEATHIGHKRTAANLASWLIEYTLYDPRLSYRNKDFNIWNTEEQFEEINNKR